MSILRQYIAPLVVVLIFALALLAVSARIFLPDDMLAPAPLGDMSAIVRPVPPQAVADLPAPLAALVRGLPDDVSGSEQL
jgi:hypothetical protein